MGASGHCRRRQRRQRPSADAQRRHRLRRPRFELSVKKNEITNAVFHPAKASGQLPEASLFKRPAPPEAAQHRELYFLPPAENGRHGFFEPLAQNGSRKLLPDTNYIFSRSLPFPLGKYGFFRSSSAATCKNFFAPSESSTPLFSRSFLIS